MVACFPAAPSSNVLQVGLVLSVQVVSVPPEFATFTVIWLPVTARFGAHVEYSERTPV
jgi:hypothetical protein